MRNHPGAHAHRQWTALPAFAGAVALMTMAACDLPTAAPIVEQRWIVPGATSRIAVATLLPAGVSILPDSSGFTLNAAMATVARPLSDDCALCVAGNGFTGLKPAMVINAAMSSKLASDISSATLTGGLLALSVTNNYTFDPLRPNGSVGPFGTAVVTVSNGLTVLGTVTLDGSEHSLAANGGKLDVNIPLAGGIAGATPVSVSIAVNSPEGAAVTMDASRTISANATPTNLKLTNALISVAGRTLRSTSDVDFSDVGEGITDRAQKGALLLNIDNPFALTSSLTVMLQPDGGEVMVKSVPLGTGNTLQTINFTRDELKKLFGHNVHVTISGLASATAGPVSVTPKQAVVVTTRFDLTLSVGG